MWNRIIAYEKTFPASKNFTLSRFHKVLDKEDFSPFILYGEKTNPMHYKIKIRHIPYPFGYGGRASVSDTTILSECQIKWDRKDKQLRLIASMSILNAMFIFTFLIASVFTTALSHSLTGLIVGIIPIGFEMIIYNNDKKRYERIGNIAMNL